MGRWWAAPRGRSTPPGAPSSQRGLGRQCSLRAERASRLAHAIRSAAGPASTGTAPRDPPAGRAGAVVGPWTAPLHCEMSPRAGVGGRREPGLTTHRPRGRGVGPPFAPSWASRSEDGRSERRGSARGWAAAGRGTCGRVQRRRHRTTGPGSATPHYSSCGIYTATGAHSAIAR